MYYLQHQPIYIFRQTSLVRKAWSHLYQAYVVRTNQVEEDNFTTNVSYIVVSHKLHNISLSCILLVNLYYQGLSQWIDQQVKEVVYCTLNSVILLTLQYPETLGKKCL